MVDILKNALSWLESQRKKHLTSLVLYKKGNGGGASFTVPATIGKTIFSIEDDYGRIVHYESRDYLISSADLLINGIIITPQKGDEVIDDGFIYEVMAPANEPEWRYSDTYRNTLRIHTKLTGKE